MLPHSEYFLDHVVQTKFELKLPTVAFVDPTFMSTRHFPSLLPHLAVGIMPQGLSCL